MTEQNNKKVKKLHPAWTITISIALLILSFSIAIQYNTQQQVLNTLESQSTEDLVALVRSLNDKRDKLEEELNSLKRTYDSLDLTASIEKQIQQLSMFAGTIPVTGPGVSVTITADSSILGLDLIDIINELKTSGAEAIAVNNTRLTTKSKIGQEVDIDGRTAITLDDKQLLTPIVITAIGKPDNLEKGLNFTGGIIDNLSTLYNVHPIVKQEEKISMPAANINMTPTYKKTKPAA